MSQDEGAGSRVGEAVAIAVLSAALCGVVEWALETVKKRRARKARNKKRRR